MNKFYKSVSYTLLFFIITVPLSLFSQIPYDISLEEYVSGFSSPVDIAHADDNRLFIVERSGTIKIINENGWQENTPFLDIDNIVHNAGNQSEQGLLGLAFHPNYKNNGYFYVHYIANNDDSIISRFSVSNNNEDLANPNSEYEILQVDQPYSNHNGGTLKFGPDGYLYIGLGDGGSANDPQNRAQNKQTLLGKMLRIDVDSGTPYSIPSNNPFVNNSSTLDEIWSIGLRNPWKFSFDRLTGDLWIGDVGQGAWEEINYQSHQSNGGENYGWKCFEGSQSFSACNGNNYLPPVAEYNHQGFTHCSVTGGFVYRGPVSGLAEYGVYIYADYCSGQMWGTYFTNNFQVETIELASYPGINISSFGEDKDGNMYAARLGLGTIYKLGIKCKSGATCPLTLSTTQTNVSCNGAFDGKATVEAEDGIGPFTYSWSDGQSGAMASGLTGFVYSVTVTDNTGNSGIATVNIYEPNAIEVDISSIPLTCEEPGGGFALANGDYPPFIINWPSGNVGSLDNDDFYSVGTYTVTVTDSENCSTTKDFEVEDESPGPEVELIGIDQKIGCVNSCIDVEIEYTNAGSNPSFTWFFEGTAIPNIFVSNLEICEAGNYSVVVVNTSNGCSTETNFSIDEESLEFFLEGTGQILTCKEPGIIVNVLSEGNVEDLGFVWYKGDIVIVDATDDNLPIDEAGFYSVMVSSDQTGCTAEENFVIEADYVPPIIINTTEQTVLTCDRTEITLSFQINEPLVTLEWTGPGFTENTTVPELRVSAPEEYNVLALCPGPNEDICFATLGFTVTQNLEAPLADAGPAVQLDCNIQEVNIGAEIIDGQEDYLYFWTSIDNHEITNQESNIATVSEAGIYELQITNPENGCSSIANVAVLANTEKPIIDFGSSPTQLNCGMDELLVSAATSTTTSGQFEFNWYSVTGEILSNSSELLTSEAGLYYLVLTDPVNQCSTEESFVVSENYEAPLAEAIADPPYLSCDNSVVTLSAVDASVVPEFVYSWTTSAGSVSSDISIEVQLPGCYVLTVLNIQNGCSSTTEICIEQNLGAPLIELGEEQTLTCTDNSIALGDPNLNLEELANYFWTFADGSTMAGQQYLNVVSPGNYCFAAEDINSGCIAEKCVAVLEDRESPVVELDPVIDFPCLETTLRLNAFVSSPNDNFSFEWNTADGNIIADQFTLQPTVGSPGTYCLIVQDTNNGCRSEDCVVVNLPENPSAEMIVKNASCFEANDGRIILDIDGGISPYSVLWSNGQEGQTLTGLGAGNYEYTLTDSRGCTQSNSVQITQPEALKLELQLTHESSAGAADGTISVQISGGQSPYSYSWSNGMNSQSLANLSGGTYTLTVTDANDCTASELVTINEFGCFLDIEFIASDVKCFGGQDGSLSVEILEGTSPFDYVWSNGMTTESITGLSAGVYDLILTDANNCTFVGTVGVGQPELLESGILSQGEISCLNETAQIELFVNGGVSPYQYDWSNGSNEAFGVYNTEGTGSVIVRDANSCEVILDFDIEANLIEPEIVILEPLSLDCANAISFIDASASTQGSNFATSWSTADGNFTSILDYQAEVNAPGHYCFVLTNLSNGCTSEECVVVESTAGPELIETQLNISCQNPSTTFVHPDDLSNYTLLWLDEAGLAIGTVEQIEFTNCGNFVLLATDPNNECVYTAAMVEIVCDSAGDVVADAGISQTLSCIRSMVSIGGKSTTGNDIKYTWYNERGVLIGNTKTISVDTCGIYTLIVIDELTTCFDEESVEVKCGTSYTIANAGPNKTLEVDCFENVLDPISLDGTSSSSGNNFSYNWAGPGIVSGQSTLTPTVNFPGVYYLSVVELVDGCASLDTVTVNLKSIEEAPMINLESSGQLDCITSEVTLDGTGSSVGPNFGYQWIGPNGVLSSDLIIVVNEPGEYTFTVTDNANGCESSLLVDVILYELQAELLLDGGLCPEETIIISTSVIGLEPFTFAWSTGEVASEIEVESGGIYSVTITDANGCVQELEIEVPETPEAISITSEIASSQDDYPSGSIDLSVTGGTMPYTFLWSNGAVTEDLDEIFGGHYTVTITDVNGCLQTETFEVEMIVATNIINSNRIQISPNPSRGEFNIESTEALTRIEAYNVLGQNINQLDLDAALECSFSIKEEGTYFLKVWTKGGGTYFAKVVVVMD